MQPHTQRNKENVRQPHTQNERQKEGSHTQNKTEKHKAVARRTQEKQEGNLSVCQPAIPYELRVTDTQSKQIEKPLRNQTNPKHKHKTIGIPLRNPKKQKKPKLWQTTPHHRFALWRSGGAVCQSFGFF